MYKDSFRHRKKFYVTLFASIYVIIFTICALVIAANWKYIKMLFNTPEKEITMEQHQFNELFLKVKQLEELSKEYNEQDYQLRAIVYVRSAQYPDDEWGDVLGESDENFETYVLNNQGDKKISLLKSLGQDYTFINPQTKQRVNFYDLFAILNALFMQDQDCGDLLGWGSYICELAVSFKDTNLLGEELYSAIKTEMITNNFFDEHARSCDFDAVNVYRVFNDNRFANKSIYLSFTMYYASVNKTSQHTNFKSGVGFKYDGLSLENEMYSRLQQNVYLQIICDSFDFDFPDKKENEENTKQAQIIRACISAYVEMLKV